MPGRVLGRITYKKGTAMTQVELGQETAIKREHWELTDESDGAEQQDIYTKAYDQESHVPIHRAADPTIVEYGNIHFQRCGGGRRVLRK